MVRKIYESEEIENIGTLESYVVEYNDYVEQIAKACKVLNTMGDDYFLTEHSYVSNIIDLCEDISIFATKTATSARKAYTVGKAEKEAEEQDI